MNKRLLFGFGIVLCLAFVLAPAGFAQAPETVTINLNLGQNPDNLDPAFVNVFSSQLIEQLFLGLVDLDDETGEVLPELAKTWTVSADGKTYTFTLRNDVKWSDGKTVTAGDVRYGILRTLDPATNTGYAEMLYAIKNAEGYNEGTVTNPNLVGVAAPDDTHLVITLEYPAAYVLSMLSTGPARPLPEWAITAHGDNWTRPGNIVTNGAYRLSQWVDDDYILLDKNPTFFDAANVQIDHVKFWIVDQDTALTMYKAGQLDTIGVPNNAVLDEILVQEVHLGKQVAIQYLGFTIYDQPVADPLVRKAFAAATNRVGLVNEVLNGRAEPALTFTPPGVPGHVDGYAQGVGIPFDPVQAQQWLADAGYPDGQGLPPVTLWCNTDPVHQELIEYVAQDWSDILNITVTTNHDDWNDYLTRVRNGEFQVWRMGWAADFPDAHNFLYSVFHSNLGYNYTGWSNATFDNLVEQAAREPNKNTRNNLYKQAEEILVETDAVIIPTYYGMQAILNKPYLERSYGLWYTYDIANWRTTWVSEVVGTEGGTLSSDDGGTSLDIPAGALDATAVMTYTPATAPPPADQLAAVGTAFDISGVYSDTGQAVDVEPGQTVSVTTAYSDSDVTGVDESTLELLWWDEGSDSWSDQGIGSTVNVTDNLVTAELSHFSLFGLIGETQSRAYLPVLLKKVKP